MKRQYPLHIHISTLFVLLILLVSSLIAGLGYKLSRDVLEATAADLTQRISRETLGELQRLVAPAEMAVTLMSYDSLTSASSFTDRWQRLRFMREALKNSATLSLIYAGYASGDFFLVRRVRDEVERQMFSAPAGTRYIVQSIERGVTPPRGRFLFLDATLETLREDDRPDFAASYDPRKQGWYWEAEAGSSQIKTLPYLLFFERKVGMTLATRAQNDRSMIGADILLETLSASLARQKVTPGTQMALVNPQGLVIAYEDAAKLVTVPDTSDAAPGLTRIDDLGLPVLAGLGEPLKNITGNGPYRARVSMKDGDWRITIDPLLLEGAQPLYLVIAIPDRELLAVAMKLRSASFLVTVLIIVLAIPITWWIARAISGTLRRLAGEAEAIRRFEFLNPVGVRSTIREVHELAVTMNVMKHTIRRFLDISREVAAERNFDRLLPMLLTETLSAADADAGVLYLADDHSLIPVAAIKSDGTVLTETLLPFSLHSAGPLMGTAVRDGQPRAGAVTAEDIQCIGLGGLMDSIDARQGVAVPLFSRQHQLVGAMLLLRRGAIEDAQVSFIKALSGSAASSLEARELIKSQKELFHAFIQLIAFAIDAKSPYTGGHCARVPELTKMLAHAACNDDSGPFRGFKLDEDDWECLHVAAWLHDCGKVTTPEYVIDKSTKLETIYNRIHEVRMRFEVLKRDAEIDCLKAIAAGENERAARKRLAGEIEQLDDDFAFTAACNEGGESMAPAKIERLKAIGSRTWLRTLDDRIGVSHEEKEGKARTPAPRLPVAESLLADKPEHLIERRPQDCIPADNRWGFRMAVPRLLYNRGELYNLSVTRGTLSEEERYKINEHIVQTLIMLSQLPFPKHLRRVPELAGGHHEKMDGSGYPRGLKKDDMSLLARMMAIADIFEALTAVDRPYKQGKTLSEAIRIMSLMKKEQHIDPDLFDLFLRSGVYREYAMRFMRPEQIDAVEALDDTLAAA
jgi:HD-GYP domain-containing protein (c-di-GMP phosphodiesterase class II)